MLVPILFGVVVLAVVIGVWIYRGTKEGKPVENAVSNPEYDPGKVLVTADENKALNKNVNAVQTDNSGMNARAEDFQSKTMENAENKTFDSGISNPVAGKTENKTSDDTQKLYTSEPVIPGEESNRNAAGKGVNSHQNKEETFEGSGVYNPSSKKTPNEDLNENTLDDLSYKESDLQEEKTVNTGQDETRKPNDPNMA